MAVPGDPAFRSLGAGSAIVRRRKAESKDNQASADQGGLQATNVWPVWARG
ncbi:hypothetical protein TESG_05352 [Trichophyton tonsurans CBS 112818]|uniref:Uncharacterized protein n=1 Tax=Trichophyton tonsurans (strain CBS 112818) TaxID=647933 RepID=F2S2P8_TRIT1|nr:hypothetical protein TESG_05352 [Trichophyton tonsurans CBS 112818]